MSGTPPSASRLCAETLAPVGEESGVSEARDPIARNGHPGAAHDPPRHWREPAEHAETGRSLNGLPPGPRAPALLQTIATWTRPAGSLDRLRRRYGRRVTTRILGLPPLVLLSDPAEIKELFTAPPDVLHPGEGARTIEPLVGPNSVILLDEAPHLEQRRLLLPAFHGERMSRLEATMEELAEREIEGWPSERPVALHERLQALTLEVVLRAVFGLEHGARLDRLRELLTQILRFSESPLSLLPFAQRVFAGRGAVGRLERLSAEADELIFDLVAERRAEHDERRAEDDERPDVLSMLLSATHEDGSPMSPAELRDELMTALVAGHETTASQLAWALSLLARDRAVAERLRARLADDPEDPFLTATIQEAMRLRPVLPNAEPRLVKRPVRIGGIEYPPGVILVASVYMVHHDPEIYPEPHAFRPERFLHAPPGTYTWIPFGGGRRRCLGATFAMLEMKIVLRAVLARFEVLAVSPRPERARRRSITISPAEGCTVLLRPRASQLAQAVIGTWPGRVAMRSSHAPIAG
jgi:cytochrome P450